MDSTISVKILYFTHILAISPSNKIRSYHKQRKWQSWINNKNEEWKRSKRYFCFNLFTQRFTPEFKNQHNVFVFFFIWKNIGKQTTSHESTVQWLSMQPLTLRFPPDTKLQLYLVLSPVPLHFQIWLVNPKVIKPKVFVLLLRLVYILINKKGNVDQFCGGHFWSVDSFEKIEKKQVLKPKKTPFTKAFRIQEI